MINILVFILVVYTLSFATVYKNAVILVYPFQIIFNIIRLITFKLVDLRKATECMICTPLYFAGFFSFLNHMFFNQIHLCPSLNIFGKADNWIFMCILILIDALSVAGSVYLLDRIESLLSTTIALNESNTSKQYSTKGMLLD